MLLSLSFGLSSALAFGASAFLIPSIIPNDVDRFEGLGHLGVDPHHHILRLECSDCSYAESDGKGGFDWVENMANSLVFEFQVQRTPDSPDTLMLNGVPLYPINLGGFAEPLSAPQLRSDALLSDANIMRSPVVGLSYTMEAHTTPIESGENGPDVAEVHLHILALNDQAVNVDTVVLTILTPKDITKGSMMIVRVTTLHEERKPAEKGGPEVEECTRSPLICKWEAIFKSKLQGLKASANKLKESAKGIKKPFKGCNFGKKQWEKIKSGDHHEGPHGPYYPHHRQHRLHGLRGVFQKIGRVVMHVVVPILIGIAAGITASLFGMAIGHIMVLCWMKFKRGGKKNAYTSVEQGDPEQDVYPEEKQSLMNEADLPKYEDVEAVAVSDEKL
ncbi:MAG: hypothetical protein M1835_001231 [Candelina submexicana]|nr:MAG: hypothetical protein M1835_001231 [Candelina submexicana]